MRRHYVIVGILVIVLSILIYVGLDSAGLMPVEASAQAADVDWMWNLEVIAMSFLFALIVAPLGYSLVVFRRRKGDTTVEVDESPRRDAIVAALDGSPAAERALPLATLLARQLGVPLHLVSASDQISSRTKRDSEHRPRDFSSPRDEPPDAYLRRTAASLRALEVSASIEVRSGPVAAEVMATLGSGDLLIRGDVLQFRQLLHRRLAGLQDIMSHAS